MTCAYAVRVALKKFSGVDSVEVSLNKGLATVKLKPGNSIRPSQVAIGPQPKFVDSDFFDCADARNKRKPLCQSVTLGLNFDDITAAKHLAAKLGDRAHQRDASGTKQRHPIANALHPLKQV